MSSIVNMQRSPKVPEQTAPGPSHEPTKKEVRIKLTPELRYFSSGSDISIPTPKGGGARAMITQNKEWCQVRLDMLDSSDDCLALYTEVTYVTNSNVFRRCFARWVRW